MYPYYFPLSATYNSYQSAAAIPPAPPPTAAGAPLLTNLPIQPQVNLYPNLDANLLNSIYQAYLIHQILNPPLAPPPVFNFVFPTVVVQPQPNPPVAANTVPAAAPATAAVSSSQVVVRREAVKDNCITNKFIFLFACSYLDLPDIGRAEGTCRSTKQYLRATKDKNCKTPFKWTDYINRYNRLLGCGLRGRIKEASVERQRKWAILLYISNEREIKCRNQFNTKELIRQSVDHFSYEQERALNLSHFKEKIRCGSCYSFTTIFAVLGKALAICHGCSKKTLGLQGVQKKYKLTPSQIMSTPHQLKKRKASLITDKQELTKPELAEKNKAKITAYNVQQAQVDLALRDLDDQSETTQLRHNILSFQQRGHLNRNIYFREDIETFLTTLKTSRRAATSSAAAAVVGDNDESDSSDKKPWVQKKKVKPSPVPAAAAAAGSKSEN